MTFVAQTYTDFGEAFTALEARVAAALPQTRRVPIPAMDPNTVYDASMTWLKPFPNTNYTVVATVEDGVAPAAASSIVRQIRSRTTTGCVIRISNSTPGQPVGQVTLHVVAIAD